MKTVAEEIAVMDRVREAVLAEPEKLEMDYWHSNDQEKPCDIECATAHCIAGWAEVVTGEGMWVALPRLMSEWHMALLPSDSPLHDDTRREDALNWLRSRAYVAHIEGLELRRVAALEAAP